MNTKTGCCGKKENQLLNRIFNSFKIPLRMLRLSKKSNKKKYKMFLI